MLQLDSELTTLSWIANWALSRRAGALMHISKFRRLALALLTGSALAVAWLPASVVVGALTPAYAQVSDEFQQALAPYGQWRQHPRWGDVWVPDQRPRGWRPYSVGHWVYTDDWGWYWISDDDEADWGWVTYHYGRWNHDRGSWFWVPGKDWSPAWVDWRRGDRYVGWAPLPPDDVVGEYNNDPTYWTFVEPRYVTAPRVRTYFVSPPRTRDLLRATVLVNRTFRSGDRIAVNPGISPAFIGAASRRPIQTYRVSPRVFTGTQGVSGAVTVRREDFRQRGQPRGPSAIAPISVQRTTTVIQPAATVPRAEPLRQGEPGRLGTRPPRAAQGGAGGATPSPQTPAAQPQASPPPMSAPPQQGMRPGMPPAAAPAAPSSPPIAAPAPMTPPPAAAPPPQRPAPPPGAVPRPGGPPPQARPERPAVPQTPPPAQSRPAAPPPPPPVVRPAAPPPPPPAPPPVARPAAPPPPPPVARPAPPPPPPPPPAPPPVAQPAPPPPAARPAPPPATVRPAVPPPAKKGPPPEEKK